MRLLDLFCGAGGAAVGYYRAGFDEIVGVDIAPMPNYPFTFIQADALTFPLDGFDFIHASPPCQKFTRINHPAKDRLADLIAPTRTRLAKAGVPYVIENVVGAPLINPIMLCGTMFDIRVIRHRLFESNWKIDAPVHRKHAGTVADGTYSGIHGGGPRSTHRIPYAEQRKRWERDIGIDWMQTRHELVEAIPPAYTQFIGAQFLDE